MHCLIVISFSMECWLADLRIFQVSGGIFLMAMLIGQFFMAMRRRFISQYLKNKERMHASVYAGYVIFLIANF